MELEALKYSALAEEFETSYKLIKLGFGELQNLDHSNSFYFLPFQLLSQGFERLMKAYICVAHIEKYGSLPKYEYLKKLSHDLNLLLKEILEKYYYNYDKPQFNVDKEFLSSNEDFIELLFIISEFGKHARYYNFDLITGSKRPSINTMDLWQQFESKIIIEKKISFEKLLSSDSAINNEVYHKIARDIIIKFEKYISALARQVIFGKLGKLGKQLSSSIFDFGMLYEKDFGNIDYRKFTTKFKQTPLKVHNRTLVDRINRRFNKNFKSKKIKKGDFKGEWPFYVDEITVERRFGHWCIITIEKRDYSLNGSAKGRYKLENPHDAGMARIGISLSDFIKIAHNL